MNVLVVEDDKDISEIVSGYLEDLDFSVNSAGSAEQALEMISDNKFDLYFIDIILPEMNGIELTKKIVSDHPSSKIVVMSGGGEGVDIVNQVLLDAAVEKGAVVSLAKPFTFRDIEEIVIQLKNA